MDPELSKEQILQGCIIKQQLIISDFEKELSQIGSALISHQESPSQDQKPSRESNELLVRMEGELIFLKNELMILEKINPNHLCDQVELGAVVVTDQRVFFISTSIEAIEINGKSVFGLSVHAPIYGAMKGKKKGDRIDYHGLRYRILDVY